MAPKVNSEDVPSVLRWDDVDCTQHYVSDESDWGGPAFTCPQCREQCDGITVQLPSGELVSPCWSCLTTFLDFLHARRVCNAEYDILNDTAYHIWRMSRSPHKKEESR